VPQSWNHPYYHTQRFVRFCTHTSYLAGSKLQQTKRLNNIITYANDNSIRTYDLEYQYYGPPKLLCHCLPESKPLPVFRNT
jgi:hypothetical protein